MKKGSNLILPFILLLAGISCCVASGFGGFFDGLDKHYVQLPFSLGHQKQTVVSLDESAVIRQVELDIDAAQVVIYNGERNSLIAGEDTVCTLDENTGLLTIRENNKRMKLRSSPIEIILTLKQETLDSMDIELDAGSVEVSFLTIRDRLRCDVDAGTAVFSQVDVGGAELDVDAGSISYNGVLRGGAKLNCDVGAISMYLQDGSTIGRVVGEADVGSVRVFSNGRKIVDKSGMESSFSEMLSGAVGRDTLEIDCDAGTVEVELLNKR